MGTRPRSRRHKWAAGMASIRLPGMISGLRMEKGTAALGGLETWSILEGMPAWAGPGQLSELQRIEKAIPSSAEQAEGRPPPPPHPTSVPGGEGRMGRNFKSVSRRQTAEHKNKNQYIK